MTKQHEWTPTGQHVKAIMAEEEALIKAATDTRVKIVPVQPTREMLQAALDASNGDKAKAWDAIHAYRMMLEAAP